MKNKDGGGAILSMRFGSSAQSPVHLSSTLSPFSLGGLDLSHPQTTGCWKSVLSIGSNGKGRYKDKGMMDAVKFNWLLLLTFKIIT